MDKATGIKYILKTIEQAAKKQCRHFNRSFHYERRKAMGDKDKGKKEEKKKAQLTPKEKRKLKQEKKDK
ncbi:MAG TPA: hypothetical protein DCQ37_00050 [Desulfobacteraceae bacterium]|nr:hypothetical protein [Desulfobacteraceae bacterium]